MSWQVIAKYQLNYGIHGALDDYLCCQTDYGMFFFIRGDIKKYPNNTLSLIMHHPQPHNYTSWTPWAKAFIKEIMAGIVKPVWASSNCSGCNPKLKACPSSTKDCEEDCSNKECCDKCEEDCIENNDGRKICRWCSAPTKKVDGFLKSYDVCSKCGR